MRQMPRGLPTFPYKLADDHGRLSGAPSCRWTNGLSYRFIRTRIESKHPQRDNLNPGNLTQALQSVPALQAKKNIKPFVLDYDRSNLRLSVVDKGFLIWLAAQDRKRLLDVLGLPIIDNGAQ